MRFIALMNLYQEQRGVEKATRDSQFQSRWHFPLTMSKVYLAHRQRLAEKFHPQRQWNEETEHVEEDKTIRRIRCVHCDGGSPGNPGSKPVSSGFPQRRSTCARRSCGASTGYPAVVEDQEC